MKTVVVVVLGLLATACSSVNRVSDVFSSPLVLPCPKYQVISDAASLVRYREGPGRDLIDVNFEGRIVDVQLGCVSNISKKTRNGSMDVDVTLVFIASRGPANRDRQAQFPYFIRILDNNGKILWGENYTVNIGFPGNKTRIQFRTEPVVLELPIRKGWNNRSYLIMTGVKLSREELKFNRDRRAKARK